MNLKGAVPTSPILSDFFILYPMSEYTELLKHPKWQKKRLEILERDNFQCRLCDDENTCLHVHHKEYIPANKPWEYENNKLITLCKDCHFIVEEIGFNIDRCKIIKLTTKTPSYKQFLIIYWNLQQERAEFMSVTKATNNPEIQIDYHISFHHIKDLIQKHQLCLNDLPIPTNTRSPL